MPFRSPSKQILEAIAVCWKGRRGHILLICQFEVDMKLQELAHQNCKSPAQARCLIVRFAFVEVPLCTKETAVDRRLQQAWAWIEQGDPVA